MNNTTTNTPTRTRQVDGLTIRYADADAASGAHDDLVPPLQGPLPRTAAAGQPVLDPGHRSLRRAQVPDQYAAVVAEWVAHRGTRSAGMKGSTDHE